MMSMKSFFFFYMQLKTRERRSFVAVRLSRVSQVSTAPINLIRQMGEGKRQHGNPLVEARIEQRFCFLVTTLWSPPSHPLCPICPSLIPSQKDVANGRLTVATSPLRLAVEHSRGRLVRVCVFVHTRIRIQLLRLKAMWLVAWRKRESDRWWRSDEGGDCVSLG